MIGSIIKNVCSLGAIDGVSLLLPFFYIPIIIDKIGLSNYGAIAKYQALMMALAMLCQFGYNVYGVKEYILIKNNSHEVDSLVAEILLGKLYGAVVISLLFSLVGFLVELPMGVILGICAYLTGEAFNPRWVMQAQGRLGRLPIYVVLVRIAQAYLIVSFVTEPQYQYNYIAYLGFPYLFFMFIAYKKEYHLAVSRVPLELIFARLRKSFPYLKSRLIVVLIDKTPVFILGLLGQNLAVGIYDLAIKINGALQIPANIVCQAVYPIALESPNHKLMIKQIIFLLTTYVFIWSITFLGWDYVATYFSVSDFQFKRVFNILYLMIFINIVSHAVGNAGLLKRHDDVSYNTSIYWSGSFYVLIISILFLFNRLTVTSIALAYVSFLFMVSLHRIYCLMFQNSR